MADDEAERLAAILVDARGCVTSVDGSAPPWRDLDADLAARVGAAFARQVGATGSALWKLGAIDDATQRRLGVDGPLFAPLPPESVSSDVTTAAVNLTTLLAPRFEPEIGVFVEDGVLRAMPCVEVTDSRFTGWSLPPWGVVADGTLQGRMFFGPATDPFDVIGVTVRHDGEELGQGEGLWAEAAGRLSLLPSDQPVRMVATGSLTALYACTPGSWSFDFGPLGEISVRVV
jgi:2-keto-4-pentenoate hydratase